MEDNSNPNRSGGAPTAPDSDPSARPKPKGGCLRRLFLALIVLVGLPVVVIAGFVYWMLTDTPAYWQVVDVESPAAIATSQAFENVLATEVTAVRGADEVWRLDMDQQEANDWIAARLPAWLANRGFDTRLLDAFRNPMVAMFGDEIEVAAAVNAPIGDVVLQMRFKPKPAEGISAGRSGAPPLQLALQSVRIGRLGVPIEWAVEQIISADLLREEDVNRVHAAVGQIDEIDLTMPLGDGRRLWIVGIMPTESGWAMSCVTGR